MATIGLNVDGDVRMGNHIPENPNILDFWLESYCGEGPTRQIYQKDHVSIFGTPNQLRAFFTAGLAALPAIPEPEPIVDQEVAG